MVSPAIQMYRHKPVLTTGMVAKIVGLAPRTISKQFDSGRLKGYRIPGSQDRRIPRKRFLEYLGEHGMTDILRDMRACDRRRIFGVTGDQALISAFEALNGEGSAYTFSCGTSVFELGMAVTGDPAVDLVIVDASFVNPDQVVRRLAEFSVTHPTVRSPRVIAITERGSEFELRSQFEVFQRPFDSMLLVERAKTLAEQR